MSFAVGLGSDADELAQSISWLPLDTAAGVIVDVATCGFYRAELGPSAPVYHVLNPRPTRWASILEFLTGCTLKFEVVPPNVWLSRLKDKIESVDHPTQQIFEFWRKKVRTTYGARGKLLSAARTF